LDLNISFYASLFTAGDRGKNLPNSKKNDRNSNKSNNFPAMGERKVSCVKDFAINQLMFTHLTLSQLWTIFLSLSLFCNTGKKATTPSKLCTTQTWADSYKII
jgi:hypothetical protein